MAADGTAAEAAAAQEAPTPDPALPGLEGEEAFAHIPEHGFSLFLARRTKVIHFVRHAEGVHNAVNAAAGNDDPVTHSTAGSWRYIDAHLTAAGISQCREARTGVLLQGVNPELVVVSPFIRALQTAHIMFAAKDLPFIVHDICRERWGKYTCDKRRTRTEIVGEIKPLFDATGDSIDFDSFGFAEEEDIRWTEEREEDECCTARGVALLKWLASRPEHDIAVVTHSSFLRHLFREFGHNIHEKDKGRLHRKTGNAEVRSITLACHRGFYPEGEWVTPEGGEDVFVPKVANFRRGKWATPPHLLEALHSKLPQTIEPASE
eukprot:CAMPEP_0182924954 /NCGR_PEP_ID=MMETSP0105_2-20130417/8049_1 /TAXON_ID=81532 ORGANISM="Acanthoeca-like sp., Strain 10tr" /NCGR_SAMPLE_ID=MMETSP0105_2 /ASSEMBLY_ACC=CAM_ASM_000205 /LENGTH=319 /DNA_ID=CAMNT_0025062779 /DNA_START=125 /DNA_END=1084 /DNA_ORIENTATION=-